MYALQISDKPQEFKPPNKMTSVTVAVSGIVQDEFEKQDIQKESLKETNALEDVCRASESRVLDVDILIQIDDDVDFDQNGLHVGIL